LLLPFLYQAPTEEPLSLPSRRQTPLAFNVRRPSADPEKPLRGFPDLYYVLIVGVTPVGLPPTRRNRCAVFLIPLYLDCVKKARKTAKRKRSVPLRPAAYPCARIKPGCRAPARSNEYSTEPMKALRKSPRAERPFSCPGEKSLRSCTACV